MSKVNIDFKRHMQNEVDVERYNELLSYVSSLPIEKFENTWLETLKVYVEKQQRIISNLKSQNIELKKELEEEKSLVIGLKEHLTLNAKPFISHGEGVKE